MMTKPNYTILLSSIAALLVSCGVSTRNLVGTAITSKTTKESKSAASSLALGYPQMKGIRVNEAIVLSINGQFGDGTWYDRRGAYNAMSNGSLAESIRPGKILLKIKPNHWKIPSYEETEISFFAKDSNHYSVSAIISQRGLQFYWMPFVYNLTTNSVVKITNQYPRSVMSLDSGRGYVPGVYTPDGVYLPGS